jgi:hypothetical protein
MNDLGGQLMHAVDRENIPKVRELLDSGAPVDYLRPDSDLTPLHIAVSFSNLQLVRLLLERGADKTKEVDNPLGEGKINVVQSAVMMARGDPDNPDASAIVMELGGQVGPPGSEPAGGAKKKNKKGGRRFTRKQCKKFKCAKMGFTQKASCRPYKNCYRSTAGVHKKRRTHKR